MRTRIRTHETRTWFFRRYALSARLELSAAEHHAIHRHRLDRHEIFVDPSRDRFLDDADRARQDGRLASAFAPRGAAGLLFAELRVFRSTFSAMRAFRISVADLIAGVRVEHHDLADIRALERILIASIDEIAATVAAATRYTRHVQDLYEPDDDEPPHARPSRWLPGRRHGA